MPENTLKTSIVIDASLGSAFKSTFLSAEQRAEKLGQAMKKAQLGSAASRDVLKYRRALDQLKRKQAEAGGSSKTLARQISQAERRYKEAARTAKQYGVTIGNAARRQKEFARTAKDAERALDRLNRQEKARQARSRLQGKAVGLLGAGYAVGRVVKKSLGREAAEVRLKTVIIPDEGDAAAAVERARQHARDYARRNLASDVDILGIQYQLGSAGLSESAARIGSEVTAKVATVTQGIPEQVGKVLAGTLNNLGDSIEGAGVEEKIRRIGDVLTQTQFAYQIDNFGQLGEGMAEASAGAIAAGVSLDQTATALGILNSSMVTGSRAGTAFRAILRQLGKASEELDFEIVRDASGELDLLATLDGLRERLANIRDVDERDSVLQRVFGDEGKVGVVPLLEKLDDYRKGLDRLKGTSRGIVDKAYQDFLDSSGGKLKIMGHQIGLLAENFAGMLVPALGAVAPPLGEVFGWMGKMMEANPVFAHGIGIVGAMLGTWKLAGLAHQFATTLPGATALWDRLTELNITARITQARMKALAVGGALRKFGSALVLMATRAIPLAVGGLKALTLAALSNPFVLIGAAVAAAAVLVWKYWEPIKAFFIGLWPPVKAAFNTAWESIKAAFLNFHPLGMVIKHWEPIKAYFAELWDWMKSAGAGLLSALAEGIASAPGTVYAALKTVLGPVGRLLPSSDAREGPLSGLTRSGRGLVSALGEGVRQAGPGPLRRPLAASLSAATAGLALAAPAAPGPALSSIAALSSEPSPGSNRSVVVNNYYRITIAQQPGEDARALANRIIREIDQRNGRGRRGELYDPVGD